MPTLKEGLNWRDQRLAVRMQAAGSDATEIGRVCGASAKSVQVFLDSLKRKENAELKKTLLAAGGGGGAKDFQEGPPPGGE